MNYIDQLDQEEVLVIKIALRPADEGWKLHALMIGDMGVFTRKQHLCKCWGCATFVRLCVVHAQPDLPPCEALRCGRVSCSRVWPGILIPSDRLKYFRGHLPFMCERCWTANFGTPAPETAPQAEQKPSDGT